MTDYSNRILVADVTSPGRGIGFSVQADLDFLITRQDDQWLVYETIEGKQRATGETLKEALAAFARELGLTGTIELCWETRGDKVEIFSWALQKNGKIKVVAA